MAIRCRFTLIQYSWQKQWNLPVLISELKSISAHTVSGSNPVTGVTDTCVSVQVITGVRHFR